MGIGALLRRVLRRRESLDPADWRTAHAECRAAVTAFDRAVSALEAGAVRDRLHALGAQLPPLLAIADRLAAAARETAPDEELTTRLIGLRAALQRMAEDGQRIADRLRADPCAADLGELLSALGTGLAEARRHGWTPISPRLSAAAATGAHPQWGCRRGVAPRRGRSGRDGAVASVG